MTRQEQALRSRQKIIDTAMLLIEEKGYSSVTIKDICEKAELSIGAFYHYFSSQFRIEDKYLYREERFLNRRLTEVIERGKACGDIGDDEETEELCWWLLRSVRGAIFDWVMHDGKTDLMATGVHDYSMVIGGMMK